MYVALICEIVKWMSVRFTFGIETLVSFPLPCCSISSIMLMAVTSSWVGSSSPSLQMVKEVTPIIDFLRDSMSMSDEILTWLVAR